MRKLSLLSDRLLGQPMFKLLVHACELEKQGVDILHFEIGDPDFDTPVQVVEEAKKSLDNKMTHYTDSMGLQELREAVARYTKKNWGFLPELSQVMINSANASINFIIQCTVNPGEEVVCPDPGFPTYVSAILASDATPVPVPLKEEDNFQMKAENIRKIITDKTRLIIINSPHNPTGSVLSEDEVFDIVQLAEEFDLFILSDEVYSKITYSKVHFSPAVYDQCRKRVILINSFSKVFAMSGWRLGFVVGPENLITQLGLLLQTVFSCLPPFIQQAGIAAFKIEDEFVNEMNQALSKRKNALLKGLNTISGISCISPEGAFYLFMNIKKTGLTSQEYAKKLLGKVGICVLPGDCFGIQGEGFVRFSYASASVGQIEEAVRRIKVFHSFLNI